MDVSEGKKQRLALWFSVSGDACFLSHRDTMRLWQRALVRADVPVHYSSGFNPHPRMTLPLPRSVGMAAQAELLLIELAGPCGIVEAARDLQRQLPRGIDINGARYVPAEVSPVPAWAEYRLVLGPQVDQSRLHERLEEFRQSAQWRLQRGARGRHPKRAVDLRRGVAQVEELESELRCTITIDPQATVRIDELLALLELNQPGQVTAVERIAAGYPLPLCPDKAMASLS
jgi:radical SAM-linked protein